VKAEQGAKITGIVQNNEVFLIFQNPGIHVLTGDIAEFNIRVDQISSDIGCAAHATIKEVRGRVFFLSDVGPRVIVGGQLPEPLGPAGADPNSSRIDPVFEQTGVPDEELLILKRAVAVQDRLGEKYILFLPAESEESGDKYANSNSVIYTYDYTKDAWLKWNNMNMAGGSAQLDGVIFWIERRYSDFESSVQHIVYKQHNLNDAWDYQDNTVPVEFSYSPQWEALGEPSVFKKFLTARIFSLEELANNELDLTVTGEANYISGVSEFTYDANFGPAGYGQSDYGDVGYGDQFEPAIRHRLGHKKYRSMRLIFENENDQENVIVTGWELEIAAPYRPQIKL